MSRMKKERSCSGGTFEFQPSSPSSSRKHLSSKEKSSTTSTSRLRYLQHANVPLVDLTIFHIPGLDVKVKSFYYKNARCDILVMTILLLILFS